MLKQFTPHGSWVINQSYYLISGNNLTIQHAAEGAGLELAVMFPILADRLITSLKVASTAVTIFADKCISTLTANEINCKKHLENSTAYATLLTPRLGYDVVSDIVKEAVTSGKTLRELVLEKHLLTKSEFNQLTSSSWHVVHKNVHYIYMTMNVLPISEVRTKLPQLVEDTIIRKTYITVKGKVKAVLVDPQELESMESTMEVLSDPETMTAIRQSERDIKAGRVFTWEQVKKDLRWEWNVPPSSYCHCQKESPQTRQKIP